MKRQKLHTWFWLVVLGAALIGGSFAAQIVAVYLGLDALSASALFQAIMLGLVILFARADGHGTTSLGMRFEWERGDWQAVGWLIAIQYGGSILTANLTADRVNVDDMTAAALLEALTHFTPLHFFAIAIGVTVLVGFAEELLFRGYLISRIEAAGIPTSGAVLLSAGLFGLVHLSGYGPILSVSKAVWFGLPSAIYFARRRKLLPIVVAHTAINFLGFVAVYLLGQLTLDIA